MSFDKQLGELLDYEDTDRAGIDPAVVIRRARRRRTRRTVAAAAATLVVAVAAAVTVDAHGPAGRQSPLTVAAPPATAAASPSQKSPPSPSATHATALSPVRAVAPGERFTVYDGLEMWVTATEKCTSTQEPGSEPSTDCRDSDSDNLQGPAAGRRDRPPILAGQSAWLHGEHALFTGIYLGRTPPARIVATDRGVETLATIVTTPGMDGWVAYYFVLPDSQPGTAPPTPQSRPSTIAFTAYDAEGRLLAGL
ncbi:hypothetical protein [Kitasatospora sp. NPDC057223]|uniref:hypothetical protein n=1 Tax=Kitasatospora sp. NPDC057223 TaxID=3346055 RepID=UPI0036407F34